MVRVWSVWPTLSVWCVIFQIEGPSLFAIPSLFVYFRGNSIEMLYAHLQSQVHPIQGMMVRVCSVWPTLSVWCVKFQIEGPSLFAIPSL